MHVQIGPITYEVAKVPELASESGELHGDINKSKCRIRINADDDPQRQHITLWHEVLHGILHNAAIDDHNEQVIDALAHGIVRALLDNPSLQNPQRSETDWSQMRRFVV